MDVTYDEHGKCLYCRDSNVCFSCKGTGKHPFIGIERDCFCPTCGGSGECPFCRGEKIRCETQPLSN